MSYYEMIRDDTVNHYVLFTEDEIAGLKKRVGVEKIKSFQNDMDDLFNAPLESVVTKERRAPGSNVHDYVSLATYWWPDKNNKDGPYIRRDGYINPEGTLYDKDKLKRLAYLVYHGSLLYFLTGEDRYLDLVKRHLCNWFINEETRMNPHLEYGQFIPGLANGRSEGIIDYGASFTYALNMIHLLHRIGALEADLLEGLLSWHRSFRTWLLESEIGKKEGSAKNNHGTFYDVALCSIEQFLGMPEEIRMRKDFFITERIEKQIAADFSLPLELARTRTITYSFMGLKGLLEEAKFLSYQGIDVFPRLKGAVNWLYENAIVHRETWPGPQLTRVDDGIYLVFRELVCGIYGSDYADIGDYVDPGKIYNRVLAYLFL
ncbi:hypothetical protein AGMMS49546_03490 [Spirochaetia bacterium]|nr:hypothetical protein AGMMS49546_03490 [Spirochaetia bacterium]